MTMTTVTSKEGLIAHNMNSFPQGKEYSYYDLSDFDDYDYTRLYEKGFREVWFWYGTGSYEGDGELIGRSEDGKWSSMNLGHCSCYGPTEDASIGTWEDTIEDLEMKFLTVEARRDVADLFNAINQR